jgi:aerobic-type carbon monoxide dehydrogenase small subunit (CoxS/CutS family)
MIKLSFTLNKSRLELLVDEMKPLSQILYEDLKVDTKERNCNGKICGNCMVLVDKEPALGCLIPAFKLQGKTVTTFEQFKQTAHYRNIKRIYDQLNIEPCPNCYEAKTLIFESILLKAKTRINQGVPLDDFSKKFATKGKKILNETEITGKTVDREFLISSCHCMNSQELLEIALKAEEDRIKRRVL